MSLRVWLPLNGDLHNQGLTLLPNTSVNTFTYAPGKIGQCATGRAAWHLNEEILGNTWSVAMWIKPESLGTANNILFCKNNTSSTDCHIYFSIISTTTLNLGVNGPSSSVAATGQTFTTGTWYHIAATYDGTTATIYLNGKELKHGTVTTAYPTGRLNMNINGRSTNAANTGTAGSITCSFNDFRLYDHCLSAAEVKEIAQGLVLHYKLDDTYMETPIFLTSTISTTAYNSQNSKYGYNADSNLARTEGFFHGKNCIKISTITAGQNAQPYSYFSNLYTSNGTNSPAYKALSFDYFTTCPTTTWLNIYKLGSGTGTATWKTISTTAGIRTGTYTNSSNSILVQPNEWNRVEVIFNGTTDADAQWGYCINGPKHTSSADYYFLFANIQLEQNDHVTGQGQGMHNATITDSSGYGHNGTIMGDLILNAETKRYSASTKWNSSDPATNNETGICYIQTPITLTTPLQMTIAWWAKPESGYGGSSNHAAFCTSNQTISPTDYNTTAFHHRDAGFDIYPSDGSGVKRLSFTYTLNQWHHYAVTYDGTTARTYQDGELKSSIEVGANKTLASFSQLYIGFSKAGGVWRKTLGSYSDFRIYVTQLLDTDIKQLYNVSMKVDNQYNVHTFEIIERNVNKINKNGQAQFSTIYENGLIEKLHYDKTIYTEPDGSTWVRVFHHNDPTTSGLFVKTSDWEQGVYENANKWYDIEQIVPLLIKYEFMVKQKTTSSANEVKYRWVQTANPLTCVYSDVSPGHVTINTSTGYTNSSYGGLWKMNSNARMCIANSSSGNWYGAMGSWTVYNTNNVPGYPNSNISTGYLDFYVRVYPNVKDIKNYGLTANEFIER